VEIPSDLPIAQVIPLLVDVMEPQENELDNEPYILETKLQNGNWRMLDDSRSLDDYLIMDGAYLRLQKKSPEAYWHDILSNQLEMLSNEKIRKSLEVWRTDE